MRKKLMDEQSLLQIYSKATVNSNDRSKRFKNDN